MWNPTTRRQHNRAGLRYGSDLTDAEWAILSPLLPPPARCGRKRTYAMRELVNAVGYVLRGGIAWRPMPDTFPLWGTVYRWFARLRDDGTWETINHHLVMRDREPAGREASPTAAVMDSQSVKTTESGGVRGYDDGKKIKGRKRHALVDTDGRALKLQAHAADIQDRDGPDRYCVRRAQAGLLCSSPKPMPAIRGRALPPQARSASASCASWKVRWALRSMHDAGGSSTSSPGSTVTAAFYAASAILLLRRLAR